MTLAELLALLDEYASSRLTLDALQQRLTTLLAGEPLGVERTDSVPWDLAHHDARLFWRLVYLLETTTEESERSRRNARRIVDAMRATGSAELTFELLPVLLDQDRFCTIVERHVAGTISRTGFQSVIAESGYPPHVKLWLEHAEPPALRRLCEWLERSAYGEAASALERAP